MTGDFRAKINKEVDVWLASRSGIFSPVVHTVRSSA